MLFLGRSTIQWLSLIAVLLQVVRQFIPDAQDTARLAIDAATAIVAALIAWVAQTSTTPTSDPQLAAGTLVRVTDDKGTVIAHTPVPTPK